MFSEEEMQGYPSLDTLEFTACNDLGRDGGAFDITYASTTISSAKTDAYKKHLEYIDEYNYSLEYGSLIIENMRVAGGNQLAINPVFTNPEFASEIEYSFEGNNISITDGVITGLVEGTETIVTAKTTYYSVTFKVVVFTDYGTLSFENVNVAVGSEVVLVPIFSIEDKSETVEYTFEGNNISIENGIVKNPRDGVKILGNGELTKKLTVKANAFSASAKEKIEALGGTAEVI
jgi:hypothetical protein